MKKGAFYFETGLMIINIIFALLAILPGDTKLLFFLWLLPLGVMQVTHSLVLGINYWEHKQIRYALLIYWAGTIADLSLLWFSHLSESLTLVAGPMLLSFYLWGITYQFRPERMKQEQYPLGNQP